MCKKFFHLLTSSIYATCILISPDSAQSSECSDLQDKCNAQCSEIRLNDILQRKCYDACQEAYRQCIKEHSHCAAEDECCILRREVEELRHKIHYLESKLYNQERGQK